MNKMKIFMIMPFDDEFFEVYEMIKTRFHEEFEFSNAAAEDNQQNIIADIIQPLCEADIILADLTGLNPNVMYELGVAHTFGKKTIVITQDNLSELPFDLKSYRTKNYTTHFKNFNELLEYLDKNLHGAVDGSVAFSNPVLDFISRKHDFNNTYLNESGYQKDSNLDEGGFLDYISEIEEDSKKMTENLQAICTNMQQMNAEIKIASKEIERVGQTHGQGTASFLKKQAKKVSDAMLKFSQQLKFHNDMNGTLWSKIERNSLALVKSDKFLSKENEPKIKKYIDDLEALKLAVVKSKEGIQKMRDVNENTKGISRSLNQSIRFLNKDLDTYLEFTDQINAGIDRIILTSGYSI